MFSKDIVRLSGIPYDVSYTGENIVAVTIWDKHEVVFVNVITNSIINTIDIGHRCYGIDFNMNRLAIRVIQLHVPTSSHIVYLDPKGKLIDRIKFLVSTPQTYHYVMIPLSVRTGTPIRFTAIH